MKKILLLLVPLLFFMGCEDNDGDEHEDHYDDYIELKSFSWKPGQNYSWYSLVVVGYEPPTNHYEYRSCKWLRLYREYELCECLENNSDSTVYVKDLSDIYGLEYEYVEM